MTLILIDQNHDSDLLKLLGKKNREYVSYTFIYILPVYLINVCVWFAANDTVWATMADPHWQSGHQCVGSSLWMIRA